MPISPSAERFGGKDSVKGNRQGSLSRWIKQLFETFLKFQKVQQPVEKVFFDRLSAPRIWVRGAVFSSRRRWSILTGAGICANIYSMLYI